MTIISSSDADWFLKADDDTYVIVENLKYLLRDYDPESPVYFGRKIWNDEKYDVGKNANSVVHPVQYTITRIESFLISCCYQHTLREAQVVNYTRPH